jgi:hypothetical protein
LDLGLDIVNGIRGLDLEGDGLARKGLDEAVFEVLISFMAWGIFEGVWGELHLHYVSRWISA